MRNLKHRVLALALIVAMAVGLAVPALALESQASGKMPIMHPLALLRSGGFYTWIMAIGLLFDTPTQRNTAGTAVPTDSPGPTIEPGKLHMSINAQFPPYAMVDDAGNYMGIDIELADAIARKLGLELVVDDMSFDASLTTVQMGRSDIAMGGIHATYERKAVMDFSEPYARNTQVIIVKHGSPITAADDLTSAQHIGVQRDTTGYIYCPDDYGKEYMVTYDSAAAAVLALLSNQVDCVIMDKKCAEDFSVTVPGLTILDDVYVNETYAIAVGKGNVQMLGAVNQAIAQLEWDGTLQAIFDKYSEASVAEGETTTAAKLLEALADNELLDKLDSVDLSDAQQVIFGYDGRFTVHLSTVTEQGMFYWLRRFRATLDDPHVDADQHYIVEIVDGKTIRFIPN